MSTSQPAWVPLIGDPPSALYDNAIWLVCPLKGFECARVPRDQHGESWAVDVIAVHVALHHRRWR